MMHPKAYQTKSLCQDCQIVKAKLVSVRLAGDLALAWHSQDPSVDVRLPPEERETDITRWLETLERCSRSISK